MFKLKKRLANILFKIKISSFFFYLTRNKEKKQNIRILNYHNTFYENKEKFIEQINFYKKNFEILDFNKLKKFLENEYKLEKPGLLITFDDGLKGNYFTAKEILEPQGIGAIFFISPDKIDMKEYMTKEEIKELLKIKNFTIGSHTCTHHRISLNDTEEILNYEIIESKNKLEKMFNIKIESFCWCGGELNTYTKKAYDKIVYLYDYSFMTNNKLVLKKENRFWLQRTNIEDDWDIDLIIFQLSGLLDFIYGKKRKIISKRLKNDSKEI